jgi:hypothetical protein
MILTLANAAYGPKVLRVYLILYVLTLIPFIFIAFNYLTNDSWDYPGGRFGTRLPFLAGYFVVYSALIIFLDIRIASQNPSTEPELGEIELQQIRHSVE